MLDAFESENQSGSSEKKAEITECTVKDGTAKLLITFSDAEEYLRFAAEYPDEESGIQVESLDVVSVQDGVEKGYIVGSKFYKAGDEKTEVSAVDITKQKKFYVVCVTAARSSRQTDGPVCVRGRDLNGIRPRRRKARRPILYLNSEKLFSWSARFPAPAVRKHCLKGWTVTIEELLCRADQHGQKEIKRRVTMEKTMEKIVALAKSRGFVYPGSEIYGGLANTWDYGNLGVELKNNVKRAWWKKFVQENPYNVGVDCAILMNSQTWVASGHIGGFSDPLMDCKACKERFRADKLIEDYMAEKGVEPETPIDGWSQEQMKKYIDDNQIPCPSCGKHDFTDIRQFNLMFKTFQGVTEDAKNTVYLRPETAQGIFVNFKNVQRTSRKKVPFGIGQIGKSFRNEITPGNFTFRTREFEQMELEFFCKPGTDLDWFAYWKQYCIKWLQDLGIKPDEMRAATILRKSFASTVRQPQTLSSYSRSAGESFGESQTEPIMT